MPRISTDNYDTVASWNGSQDLFVVEQPDGTKVATPAMVKQYVLNDMDEVPTQNSNDTVKSGGVFSAVDDVYSVMGQNGAKNLIPYPYYESDHTESGITWTVNSDGSVTANGTATANSTFIFRHRTEQTKFVEKNTSYILSGCPSGGSSSKYLLNLFVKNQDDSNVAAGIDYGNGRIIDMPDQDYYGIYAFARVISGQTVSNLTFEPMLRLASDTDNTYEPYAMTNKQLTDQLETKQDTLTFDNVPTQNSNNPVKSGGIKSSIDDKAKRLNNIKIIDENFEIRFIGFSDVANRILCPIIFPFAFANNDYTLECTLLDLASVGRFTTGISVNGKDRSSALIILSKTSSAGAVYCGVANIHISRTE